MDPIIQQPRNLTTPELPPPHRHFLNKKFIVTFVILLLVGVGAYAGMWWKFGGIKPMLCGFGVVDVLGVCPAGFICQGANPPNPDAGGVCVRGKVAVTPKADATAGWKTYTNTQYGFSFKYPSKLNSTENDNVVTLNHSIPYENNGPCDMSGLDNPKNNVTNVYKNLNDFNLSFEIVKGKAGPLGWAEGQFDGQYNLGQLKGNWAFEGIEGCGYTGYYFPLENGTTLVVKKDSIQAWQGFSWNTDEILKIPNVINSKENEEIFNQILSTFKFTDSILQNGTGTLTGHVTIGPNCPVEQVGNPCTPAPQAYAAVQVIVYDNNGERTIQKTNLDVDGNYSLQLLSASYMVDYEDDYLNHHAPLPITIKSGQTATLNFSIDTGIR